MILNPSSRTLNGKETDLPSGVTVRTGRPQVHVAMLGARQHYAVARLLHEEGMLGRLYTDLYAANKSWVTRLAGLLPPKIYPREVEKFLGRSDRELPAEKVVSYEPFGVWYFLQARRARDAQALSRIYARGAQSFARRVIRNGLPGADILYCYNGPAPELFEYAKGRGIPCILEQILAPQEVARALLREERDRWPGWEPESELEEGDNGLAEREREEWRLADLIVGGSSFVIDGLRAQQVPQGKCRVVPYGVPLESFPASERPKSKASEKLRVLFAGGIDLRKGVPYLLGALRLLGSSSIEARIVGASAVKPDRLRPYQAVATFLGSVPRSRMADLYQWADVFVLPSICEGSAIVTYEALASGLPVVATPNTGAMVREGIDGVLVPIRDVEALAKVLERFARDREFLRFCSQNALAGRERLGLPVYREKLVGIIRAAVGKSLLNEGT